MSAVDEAAVRDECAQQIETILAANTRFALPANSTTPSRARLHINITRQVRDLAESHARRDGRAAVVMAGVPGAGKTSALRGRDDLADHFHVDADELKDLLLAYDVTTGRFDSLLAVVLADGRQVKPAELAAFVHAESTHLYNQVMRALLRGKFNVILDGTLQYPPQGPRLVGALRDAEYERLELVAVEVPEDVAQRQAVTRWWEGRLDPTRPLGGRYTPRAAISAMYPDPDRAESICLTRAVAAFNLPQVAPFESTTLTIVNRHGIGEPALQFKRLYGDHQGTAPDPATVLGLTKTPAVTNIGPQVTDSGAAMGTPPS